MTKAQKEKKPQPIEESIEPIKPKAKQQHRIVTTFSKEVDIDEVESDDPDEEDDFPEIEIPPATVMIADEPEMPDSIASMLADLRITDRQHSWTCVIERLPNYEKDSRYDVNAKRVNCGTRPMTTDFIEDMRREFARPGKANHFRVTIKRDGKIYAHWPEVISLEPPPPDEIAEYESKAAAAMPAITINNPGQSQSFKDLINQLKQLGELKSVLFPELAGQAQASAAAPAPPPQPLTEEAALLKLLSSNDDVIERLSKQISKKLFSSQPDRESESSWLDVAKSALDNGPGIVQAIFNGLAQMRSGDPAVIPSPPFPGAPMPAPPLPAPPGPAHVDSPPQPPAPMPPEAVLLTNVIRFCESQQPATAAAAFVNSFVEQNPTVDPLIEMFLAMKPPEAVGFMLQVFPDSRPIVTAPHAEQWIADLQNALKADEEAPNE